MQAIPKNAKRVFHGVLFDVYQWRQRLFNGDYATFENAKLPDVVQVIAVVGNRVMMTMERQPGFRAYYRGMPGGRVEKGERPLNAAKRELEEETGYVSKDWELFGAEVHANRVKRNVYWYIARDCKKVSDTKLDPGGEKIRIVMLRFDDFIESTRRIWDSPAVRIIDVRSDRKQKTALRKRLFG